MSDDEQARRDRAARLRKKIEQLKSDEQASEEEESAEIQPGESPREYVERRMRKISGNNQSSRE